jgi:hypothetical protein
MLLHLEFRLNFPTIFVGSFDIGASRKFFSNEVRSPETDRKKHKKLDFGACKFKVVL